MQRDRQLKIRIDNAKRFKQHWNAVRSTWRDEVEFRKATQEYAMDYVKENDF